MILTLCCSGESIAVFTCHGCQSLSLSFSRHWDPSYRGLLSQPKTDYSQSCYIIPSIALQPMYFSTNIIVLWGDMVTSTAYILTLDSACFAAGTKNTPQTSTQIVCASSLALHGSSPHQNESNVNGVKIESCRKYGSANE